MTRRPLLAVNGLQAPRLHSTWHREPIREADSATAWPLFKAIVPTIPDCRYGDDGKPLGKARQVQPADMTVFDRIALANGGVLIGARAKALEDCEAENGYASHVWVLKPVAGHAFPLRGFDRAGWAYQLTLVDIGRFADGDDEQAVFFYSGYNEDGYVMYHDHLRQHLQFTWGYH